jgi:hypothetical protein
VSLLPEGVLRDKIVTAFLAASGSNIKGELPIYVARYLMRPKGTYYPKEGRHIQIFARVAGEPQFPTNTSTDDWWGSLHYWSPVLNDYMRNSDDGSVTLISRYVE